MLEFTIAPIPPDTKPPTGMYDTLVGAFAKLKEGSSMKFAVADKRKVLIFQQVIRDRLGKGVSSLTTRADGVYLFKRAK